ncbi:MAG TPA: hypothetical protein VF901_01160 [Bradyrhizobium sp.]
MKVLDFDPSLSSQGRIVDVLGAKRVDFLTAGAGEKVLPWRIEASRLSLDAPERVVRICDDRDN